MEKYEFKIVSSLDELQKAFCVRNIVFVDGQNCAYSEEFDGRDFEATHFLALDGDEPVATARIRHLDGAIKFERLAVRKEYRGNGTGKRFFRYVLDHAESLGCGKIKMHAQAYLTRFYEEFGFEKKGDTFLEAGIEHYYMEKILDRGGRG